jgi:C4-dicarboxylate-specific signal transduction histidine kinase
VKQRRLFALVVLVVTVVLLVAVLSGFKLYGDAVTENERESLQASADSTATQLDALLTERIQMVQLLGADSELQTVLGADSSGQVSRTTLQRFISVTEFQGVSLIDADGRMVAIESQGLSESNRTTLIGSDFSDREYFQRAMGGETYVSEPVAAETGNFIVTVSVPLEENGTVVGTLVVGFAMTTFGHGPFPVTRLTKRLWEWWHRPWFAGRDRRGRGR